MPTATLKHWSESSAQTIAGEIEVDLTSQPWMLFADIKAKHTYMLAFACKNRDNADKWTHGMQKAAFWRELLRLAKIDNELEYQKELRKSYYNYED